MASDRIRIASVDDPRLEDFRIVSDPALMRDRGLFVAEGRLAVERLLASRFRARALLVLDAALSGLEPSLCASADAPAGTEDGSGPSVYVADAVLLRAVTGFRFHRGCLALGERPALGAAGSGVLPQAAPGRPLVVLDGVSDPDNVGSIFRNAAAFGAAGVILSPTCADPLYRKAIRTSMGTTLQLPFRTADAWPGILDRLREAGVRVAALTPLVPATDIETFVRRRGAGSVALVLGNEGAGVGAAALDRCDERIRIDIAPAVDSLNVAVAGAIALQRIRAAMPSGGGIGVAGRRPAGPPATGSAAGGPPGAGSSRPGGR